MKNDFQMAQEQIPSRRIKRWLPPVAGVILVGAIGASWLTLHTNTNGATANPDVTKIDEVQELASTDFATAEARELIVTLPISGALTPLNQVTVKSKVIASVLATLVPEGVKVARGEVVMRLDDGDLRAHLIAQEAAQDDAKAKLSLAMKNHENNQTLLRQKFISQTAYDTAENNVDIARAALKSAASQVEIARRALDDATIRAPIDGIISKRFVQPGEKASPDTPMFAMVDLRQMILEAQVPASEIPRVKEGQGVQFNVEGFDKRSFIGKVARINPTAETGSRAMTVYVAVNNADGALRGGMFAKGNIALAKSAVSTLVPLAAIRQENGASTVYKIENNKIVVQTVKVGLRNDDEGMIEISSGLNTGAKVMIVKLDGIKAGSAVKLPPSVQNAAPTTAPKNASAVALKG
ncbi:MAG TPA: efflux RND transporter periplasmic adaptor subunit [Burkholderiaceae bacterium]|jgi:membrane fusion protein (multidrug efflux system)|nr:efflux RND transporter periplasmic adaptor subunit [Burkholderiaceae bacterium]